MKIAVAAASLLAAAAMPAVAAAAYWNQRSSGWFWYERPQLLTVPDKPPQPAEAEPAEPVEVEPAEPAEPVAEQVPPEVAAHRRLQQRLEQQRIIAIMAPTAAHVEAYLRTQQEVLDRSAAFASMWQQVVWSTPDLDYSVAGRPTNAAALYTYDAERARSRAEQLEEAAADHGLFFVYGPDCLHCAQMGAALQRFEHTYGMRVQGVAVGQADPATFAGSWPDNGFAQAAGVASLPAVLLARLDGSRAVQPVAFGPLSDEELEQRVSILAGAEPAGAQF